ncbi:transposase [Streptomyces asoensis]
MDRQRPFLAAGRSRTGPRGAACTRRHRPAVMPQRRRAGEKLPGWREAHNKSHKQVRARVEHVFARMKTWKILRDCRLKGDGVHHAMLGIARLHNLTLAG